MDIVKETTHVFKALPKELCEADPVMAVRVLVKAFSIIFLGFVLLWEPILIPFGIMLIGIGMTFLYLVGYECSQLSFFKSYSANMVARFLAWAPLLTSIEGDWVGGFLARLAPACIIASLCFYMGFERFIIAFLKYWLLPLFIVHVNIKNSMYGQKEYNKAVALLFPELAGDVNLLNVLANVPFYKLDKALELMNIDLVSNAKSRVGGLFSLLSFPSNYWMCEILFWHKRDILIELALASAAVIAGLHYYALVHPTGLAISLCLPLLLVVLGFITNSRGTALLERSFLKAGVSGLKASFSTWSTAEPHWFNIIYLGFCHLWAVAALIFALPQTHFSTFLFSVVFMHALYGMGITVGCHRMWSHRSFTGSLPVRIFFMLLASGANQGSIWHWVRDHRLHHRYSDTELDPHNANNGFWFSHFGWLMVKKSDKVIQAGQKMDMDDMNADKVVMFQKKYYPFMALTFCFGIPTLLTMYFFGEHWLVALSLSYLRYVTVLNATWCVNSVAHFFGYHPYRPEERPAENLLVSIMAVGEGWHNYHHAYPFDYATSEYGVLGQWNPSKLFIDCMAAVGLVSNRKRAAHLAEKARRRNGWMTEEEANAIKAH